jgi:glycosyltransferase involved in cell wall biosynthesis
MIEGNDIICFSNDWDGDPLSKKHIITRLARRNRVLWVNSTGNRNPSASVRDCRRAWKKVRQHLEGCRQVATNIFVYSPLVIPFHASPAARWVNRRFLAWSLRQTCRQLGFRKPITWTFVPSSSDVAGSLGERLVVYHCVDEFSKFAGAEKAGIAGMERDLLAKSDMVIVSSSRLYETKRAYNPNTCLVTHGVDVEHFRTACTTSLDTPPDCAGMTRPVIGFFGLIAEWVDVEVFRYLAAARPEWTLLLIGEVQADTTALRNLPNVRILGRRSYDSLPAYCRTFDVAILPFVTNELTTAANPLKLREYLAAGLPVVSTPLPEVMKLNGLIRTATRPDEFLREVEGLLAQGRRGPNLEVSRSMDRESWDEKVEELSDLVSSLDSYGRSRSRPLTEAWVG